MDTERRDEASRAHAAQPAAHAASGHVKTAGEKRFDMLTYTGINYVANVLLSIAAVYWVERTKGGRHFLDRFGDKIGTIPGVNKETAKMLASKSFFLSGGFAVLAPVKWMEDAKVGLVKKWNREIYGNRADIDPEIVQSEREMEAAPKQTWGTVFASRILSLIPFYITVGLLWDRTSLLSKATNPELRSMTKEGIKELSAENPAQFSSIASKGFYIDKPISWASRLIGHKVAKVKGDTKALKQIEEMSKTYPGMIKEGADALTRDPNHSAIPYYFISEAITSGMVAAGMYAITRVLAPIMGKKPESTVEAASIQHQPPSRAAAEIGHS